MISLKKCEVRSKGEFKMIENEKQSDCVQCGAANLGVMAQINAKAPHVRPA